MSLSLQDKCDKFVKYADSLGWRVSISWAEDEFDSTLIYLVPDEHRWLKHIIYNEDAGSNTFEHYCVYLSGAERSLTSFEAKVLSVELAKLDDLCSAWNSLNFTKQQAEDGSLITCLKKSYHNMGKRILNYAKV